MALSPWQHLRWKPPVQGMNGTQCRHPCRYGTIHGLSPMIISERSPVSARYLWWTRALTGFGRLLSQPPGLGCSPGMTSHDSEFLTLWHWDPSISESVEDKVQTRLILDSLTLWHGTQSVTEHLTIIRMGTWT